MYSQPEEPETSQPVHECSLVDCCGAMIFTWMLAHEVSPLTGVGILEKIKLRILDEMDDSENEEESHE